MMAGTLDDAVDVILQANRNPSVIVRSNLARAIDTIVMCTRRTYEDEAESYEELRGSEISQQDARINRLLIDSVGARLATGLLDSPNPTTWRLLDVGAGYGRDAKFFSMQPGIRVSVVENCAPFLEILERRSSSGDIFLDRVIDADMRDLSAITDGSYECVRNHATLHHLPLAPYGLGADAAVHETRRVLVNGGIFYCFVKSGHGVAVTDTGEGLGKRFYQFFTEQPLRELLLRHHLEPFHCETVLESRPAGDVAWIMMLAYAR
jgi:SAM-dependent methyltransferase